MKKTFRNIRTLAALLMAGAAFAACSSSDDNAIEQQPANPGEQVYTLTVNATKDGGSQTRALNLDGEKLVASWETTDHIAVINKTKYYSSSGSLNPTNISADGKSATLTGEVTGVAEGDDLILTYHYHNISDFAGQNGRLNGDAVNSAEAYDQAEATVTVASIDDSGNITTTADASFTTQTAMIKFTLQDNAATPNKINATSLNVKATITLPAPLSTTITEDLFTFTIAPEAYTYNGNGILYYALPSAATLAGPIATKLKADPYNLTTITESDVVTALASATITFTASDGVNTYTVDKTGYPFAAGSYYTSALTMAQVGKFSVSSTKQVYFSKGNLRYVSGAWSFFDHQYDYYATYSADAWDKFGWSNSTSNFGMSTSTSIDDFKGDLVDWGTVPGIGSGWYTLSISEWEYLFNTRSASTVNSVDDARYAKGKVNGVYGIILFPDTYTHPTGVTLPVGINQVGNAGWNGNNYSAADWTAMETAGCVFLPATGYRQGPSVLSAGASCSYRSSSRFDEEQVNYVYFTATSLYVSSSSKNYGFYGQCVRLVRNAN